MLEKVTGSPSPGRLIVKPFPGQLSAVRRVTITRAPCYTTSAFLLPSPTYYNLSSLVPGRPSSFNQVDVRCLKNIAFYNHGNGRVA